MIIHELKTVFIHIPKTAGVSIVHSLISNVLEYETTGNIKDLPTNIKQRFSVSGQQKHKRAKEYFPADITHQMWNDYYKFTFVRNPWDRAVSEFHWRHNQPNNKPSKDFKKFLSHCEERITGKKKGIYWTHAQTQKSYITDAEGNIILNDVFKFEDMTNSIKIISDKLNIPIELKQHNTSNHKYYKEYYNNETEAIVRRLYKDDIELFDYEF